MDVAGIVKRLAKKHGIPLESIEEKEDKILEVTTKQSYTSESWDYVFQMMDDWDLEVGEYIIIPVVGFEEKKNNDWRREKRESDGNSD